MSESGTEPKHRKEIESLIQESFPVCPFCRNTRLTFTWGHLVPKRMTCHNCGASWEPLMSYDGVWSMISAKLVSVDSFGKGKDFLNKMLSAEFWEKMAHSSLGQKLKEGRLELPKQPEKVVIIREVIKIRCRYCGGLYNEIKDRCPYCGGAR